MSWVSTRSTRLTPASTKVDELLNMWRLIKEMDEEDAAGVEVEEAETPGAG